TVFAGGAVGPGRMSDVGPVAFEVLLHSVASFGIGGVLGAVVVCWWQREDEGWLRTRLGAVRDRLPRRG
ncbi:MAG: hypothetical protein L0H31_12125, partial [Nocardioidaceae bacterium]|nr:hypothetical protein [Nocardioidaceae bacterium]